jgi:hypothetical protein
VKRNGLTESLRQGILRKLYWLTERSAFNLCIAVKS